VIEAMFDVALLGAVVPGLRLVPGPRTRGQAGRVALGSAILLAIAMLLAPGAVAGVFAIPWLAVTVAAAAARLPDLWSRRESFAALGDGLMADAAVAFLAVGAAWAAISRFGLRPMGFDERIVLLTAVHFHVAGFVLVLAGELLRRRRSSWLTTVGLAGLLVGIPTTAAGFLGVGVASLVGAWLVAAGGLAIGVGHTAAGRSRDVVGLGAQPAVIAGVALLLSMPLAVAWATTSWLGIGFLSIPLMAGAHGGLNVFGFAIPAMYAWREARG
jgi:hypothetical protein